MALCGGLISHFAVAEARAVANSLAKLRVYWAMMGHVDYALSRMRQENPDDTTKTWTTDVGPTGIQGELLTYLDELGRANDGDDCRVAPVAADTVTSESFSRCSSWPYDEISDDYVFHFEWTVYDIDPDDFTDAASIAATVNGRLGVRVDYVLEGKDNTILNTPTSSVGSLDKLSGRLRDLEYEVCFAEPASPIGNCSVFSTTATLDDASGASRVTGVRRCRYVDGGTAGTLSGTTDLTTDDTCS